MSLADRDGQGVGSGALAKLLGAATRRAHAARPQSAQIMIRCQAGHVEDLRRTAEYPTRISEY